MSAPTVIDVPHRLGQAGARDRLKERVGDLGSHIPGGMAEVRSSWLGENEMALEVTAMGQHVSARLEVMERVVRVHLLLPGLLGMMSGVIAAAVRTGGEKMLEDKSRA